MDASLQKLARKEIIISCLAEQHKEITKNKTIETEMGTAMP